MLDAEWNDALPRGAAFDDNDSGTLLPGMEALG